MILIGCTKEKLDNAAPARDLYTGRVFRASVDYAEAVGLPWAVLSARHGVIAPDAVIEPYDVTPSKMTKGERLSWAGLIAEQLDEHQAPGRVTVLAGREYVAACERYGRHRTFDAPLDGLGIGDRYARLVQMREAVLMERAEDAAVDEAVRFLREAVEHGAEAILSTAQAKALLARVSRAR